MNFSGKKLIIFDFDGTLINSIPDITTATNKMLSHYKFNPITDKEVTPFIGNGAKTLVKRALDLMMGIHSYSDEFLEEAYLIYLSAYQDARCKETYLYPGVLDTLNYLHQKEYKMTICTNKPYRFIEPILDKLSIKKFFTDWVGEDSLEQKKPDAAPLLHLVAKTNSTTSESIMVGDSKNDIMAAKNAGMDSIGVSYGYNYHENIAESKPTVTVNNFDALKTLF